MEKKFWTKFFCFGGTHLKPPPPLPPLPPLLHPLETSGKIWEKKIGVGNFLCGGGSPTVTPLNTPLPAPTGSFWVDFFRIRIWVEFFFLGGPPSLFPPPASTGSFWDDFYEQNFGGNFMLRVTPPPPTSSTPGSFWEDFGGK